MTDIFCNIDNTGVTNGTSHVTGFTRIQDAYAGATMGDRIYVAAGTTHYAAIGSDRILNSDLDMTTAKPWNRKGISIIGIGSAGITASNIPVGDDRPLVYCAVTTTSSYSVYIPAGSSVSNIRFTGLRMAAASWESGGLVAGTNVRVYNCKFTGENTNEVIGQNQLVVSFTGTITDCEFIEELDQSNWPARVQSTDCSFYMDTPDIRNCVFRITSNLEVPCFTRNRSSWASTRVDNCIFYGNGYQTSALLPNGTVQCTPYSGVRFHGCIFYNLANGYDVQIPTSIYNVGTEAGWAARARYNRLQDCIFANCGNGVVVASYIDPSGWVSGTFSMEHVTLVSRCFFHDITTANLSGDLSTDQIYQLSSDPFVDAANGDFRLNDTAGGGADIKALDSLYTNSNIKSRGLAFGGGFASNVAETVPIITTF
jgi:hypothetical protein